MQIALDLDVLDAEITKGDDAETAGFPPDVAKLVELARNLRITSPIVKILGV